MARKKKVGDEELEAKRPAMPPAISELRLLMKYLVVSGKDEMKVSRSVEGRVEDLSMNGLIFQTTSMKVDDLHLSYNETPMMRNKLTVEIDIPGGRKVTAIGEVNWYERSLVAQEKIYHVGVTFKEMSPEDQESLKEYLVATKKAVRAIRLDV